MADARSAVAHSGEERILYEAEQRALRMVRQNMNQVREYRG